jgi:hypothetical protein
MHEAGMTLAEAQMGEDNQAAHALFEKLGFQLADHSLVLRKTVDQSAAG